MQSKISRRLLKAGGLLLVAVMVLTTAGAFVLPVYLQSRVIPRLAAGFGLDAAEVHVRHIGLWGADLGPIRLRAGDAPAVTLAAVQIDYSPWSLLRGRLEGITLGGVGLELAATSGGITIAGFKIQDRPSAGIQTRAGLDIENLLPVGLDRFTILQSRVDVDWKERRHSIPFTLRLNTAELGRGILRGQVDLSVSGNPVSIEAELNQRADRAVLKFECRRFRLASLAQFGLLPDGAEVSGNLDLEGRCSLQLNPVRVAGFELSGRLNGARATVAGGSLGNMTSSQGLAQPAVVSASAADAQHVSFACGPFQFDGPLKTAVTAIKGDLEKGPRGWSLDALVETLIPRQNPGGGYAWQSELPMSWRITAAEATDKSIGFKVLSSGDQKLAVSRQALHLSGQGYWAEISGDYADHRIAVDGKLSVGKLQLSTPEGVVTTAGASVGGTLTTAGGPQPEPARINLRSVLPEVRAKVGDAVATLPRIQIEVDGRADPGGAWTMQGRVKIVDGSMQDKAHQTVLTGLDIDLPVQWPPTPEVPPGRLDLGAIQWRRHRLGGLAGTLQQEARGLKLNLEHRSKLLQGLIVLINGRLGTEGIHAEARVHSYQPGQAVDLGRFSPNLAGMRANGRIEVQGVLDAGGGEAQGTAYVKVDQGSLTQDERLLKLDGIAMTLHIDDLTTLKSAPRQNLRVEKLQLGELRASNLDVDFQLEDRKTLFLEKAGLRWCQGRINAGAIRIIQGKDDYDVTLFCDRLNLAMVLEQLGAAEAGGDGSVNGRIPMRWVNGRLSFDNGFLYSTPGQTGQIQLKGTETLVAGMPPGSPQRTQLDIATEALKDYTYQWAKLSVQSDKDILLLKLQLDGKPNRLLPFAYNQQLGQFERVTGKGQAEFKGISIDLNFKSPLNEIIHYKEFLNRK